MKIKSCINLHWLLGMLLFLTTNKNIAMDQAVAATQNRLIFVKTTDKHVVPVEQWQIKQMNVLSVALQDQHNKSSFNLNNAQNPIPAPINFDDLTLVQNALQAASKNELSDFFHHQWKHLRHLINAAEKIQANKLSAMCATELIPVPYEDQKKITIPFIFNAVKFFKNCMISHSAVTGRKHIGNISLARNATCSNDNKTIAAIDGKEEKVYLYDLLTGTKIRPINTKLGNHTSISFSPDGTKLAIIGTNAANNNLEIHNVSNGELLQTIKSGNGCVQFSPSDNNLLLYWTKGGECRLYDTNNGSIIDDLANFYQGTINDVIFSPDGTQLLIVGNNANHYNFLWNIATKALITNLSNKKYDTASFSPDGKQIVLSNKKQQCLLLNITDINNIGTQNLTDTIPHPYKIGWDPSAKFAPYGNNILLHAQGKYQTNVSNSKIIMWNLDKNTVDFDANFLKDSAWRQIMFSPDGRWIIAAMNDSHTDPSGLSAWNIFSKENEKTLELFEDLDTAQARLVYELCKSENPSFEERQGLYEKLIQSKVDFNIFQTLPEKIQKLFTEELFVPIITSPCKRSEYVGQECTIL